MPLKSLFSFRYRDVCKRLKECKDYEQIRDLYFSRGILHSFWRIDLNETNEIWVIRIKKRIITRYLENQKSHGEKRIYTKAKYPLIFRPIDRQNSNWSFSKFHKYFFVILIVINYFDKRKNDIKTIKYTKYFYISAINVHHRALIVTICTVDFPSQRAIRKLTHGRPSHCRVKIAFSFRLFFFFFPPIDECPGNVN